MSLENLHGYLGALRGQKCKTRSDRCRDHWRRRRRLLRGAQPAAARHQTADHLQGPGRQKRRVAVRRQPGDFRPAARQHRRAGAQHRRIPDQVPQSIPDRSELGAPLRPVDRAASITRSSRKPGSISGATTPAMSSPARARSAASPPTCRAIPACRSWICGASRSSGPAFRGWRKPSRLRCCASRTARSAACSASTS